MYELSELAVHYRVVGPCVSLIRNVSNLPLPPLKWWFVRCYVQIMPLLRILFNVFGS